MKYIRTKNEIIDLSKVIIGENGWQSIEEYIAFRQDDQQEPIKVVDTIEKLFDEIIFNNSSTKENPFVTYTMINLPREKLASYQKEYVGLNIYGAIWTDKGLTYVAKMNNKGEWELL